MWCDAKSIICRQDSGGGAEVRLLPAIRRQIPDVDSAAPRHRGTAVLLWNNCFLRISDWCLGKQLSGALNEYFPSWGSNLGRKGQKNFYTSKYHLLQMLECQMIQGHFTAQFFQFFVSFLFFPSWLLRYIVSDYCITSQENESRLVGWCWIWHQCSHDHDKDHDHDYDRHGCDLNWLTWIDLKMMAKSKLLYVVLHGFLLFQAKSPKGGKSKAHRTALGRKSSQTFFQ